VKNKGIDNMDTSSN